jgi:hypothetical protein
MKTCATCSIAKPAEAFKNRRASCTECFNARRRATRDYAAESPAKRAGEKARPEQHRASIKRRSARSIETMSDGYVRRMFHKQLSADEIPQEFVELKRAHLALKRALKDTDGRE